MQKEIWKVRHVPNAKHLELAEKLGCSLPFAQILSLRGIETEEEARLFLGEGGSFHSPYELSGMDKAVKRIVQAAKNREKVVIYGDYDVDGVTATAILLELFAKCQMDVGYYLPHRVEEGYGLNLEAVRLLRDQGTDLLITVDCGITSLEIAQEIREMGMDLIVTDHHTPLDTVPEAVAVINPHLDSYPAPLCGAGVALKLAQALSGEAPQYFRLTPASAQLAAFGTVADIVDLIDENRRIVKSGLASINKEPIPGLKALIAATGLDGSEITASKIAFILAPKINAAGRIGSAERGLKLLMETDYSKALEVAHELCALNEERRSIEEDILKEALDMAEAQSHRKALVVAGSGWHSGVIGIVASRLVERFHKPTVVIGLQDDHCQGSCRSIESLNMYKALDDLSDYLEAYGGHEMAAGLTVKREMFDSFQQAFFDYCDRVLTDEDLVPKVSVDLLLEGRLSTDLVEELDLLEPCGAGNPKPVVGLREVPLDNFYLVGSNQHLKLQIRCAGASVDAIGFGMAYLEKEIQEADRVDVAGYLTINDFQGQKNVSFNVRHLRASSLGWERPGNQGIWKFWHTLPGGELRYLADRYLSGELELDLPSCGIIPAFEVLHKKLLLDPRITLVRTTRDLNMPETKPQLVPEKVGFEIDDDHKLMAFIASGAKECTLSYLPGDYWLWRLFWEVAQGCLRVGIGFTAEELTKVQRAHSLRYPSDDDLRRIYIYLKSTAYRSVWRESFRQAAIDLQNRYDKPFSEESVETAVQIFLELGLMTKTKINGTGRTGYVLEDAKQKLDLNASLSYNEGIIRKQELDRYAREVAAL